MELGKIIHGALGERDAVHVCCIVAYTRDGDVNPGDKVKFTDSQYDEVILAENDDWDGIVDPFLLDYGVDRGFIVILKPSMVKGLSHHFELDEDDPDGIGCGRTCG